MTPRQTEIPPALWIVDDDAEFRALVRRVAEPLGWSILEFENGRDMISAIARSSQPDLIILDMVMPVFDGIETIGWIGANSMRCPVILITGRPPVYTDTARDLGLANDIEIMDVLHKPISLKNLRSAIDPGRVLKRT